MKRRIDVSLVPEPVLEAMDVLLEGRGEAYLVGGSVRDLLLGLEPYDYDIATNLYPEEVLRLFSSKGYKAVPTGIAYGTVTVIVEDMSIEITTYRSEVYFEHRGRKPIVSYATTLFEDVWRRDFTVNALAMNRRGEIIDYVGGLRDLEAKLIRFVGEPYERIREDPLRMLRALRLSAKLDFKIEEGSIESIKEHYYMLDNVSWERRRDELLKAGKTPRFRGFVKLLYDTRLYQYVIPELSLIEDKGRLLELLGRADKLGLDPYMKLAVIYYQIYEAIRGYTYKYKGMEKNIVDNSLRRLKLSNRVVQETTSIIVGASKLIEKSSECCIRPDELGIEAFLIAGDNGGRALGLAYTVTSRRVFQEALRVFERVRIRHRKPLLDGNTIMMLYANPKPGAWVGAKKRILYELQVRRDVTSVNELVGLALGKIIPVSGFERFLYKVVESIREEHRGDIELFLRGDNPSSDCIEINGELVKKLAELGIKAELVRLPSIKHWVARIRLGGRKTYYVDAVPELSGTSNEELFGVPLVYEGSIDKLEELYLGETVEERAMTQLAKTI